MNRAEQVYDEFLVLRCQDGEIAAIETLYKRWQPRLLSHAQIVCGNRDAAEDIVQNAWIAMLKSFGQLRDPAQFKYWAYRTVSNKCIDYGRQRTRGKNLQSILTQENEHHNQGNTQEHLDEHQKIEALFRQLPDEQREVMALHYLRGFDLNEITNILDVPVGTIKSRLFYARRAFHSLLEESDV